MPDSQPCREKQTIPQIPNEFVGNAVLQETTSGMLCGNCERYKLNVY